MNTVRAAAPTRSGARSQRLFRQGAERTHAGTAIGIRRVIGHLGSYGRVASDVRLWPSVAAGSIVMVGGD